MKKCQKEACDNPVFGGKYCRYHQYMREKHPIKDGDILMVNHGEPDKLFWIGDDIPPYREKLDTSSIHTLYMNGIMTHIDNDGTIHNEIMPLDFNIEHSTDDLQQDDIIYHKEKIVSPTSSKGLKRTPLKKTRKKSNHVEIYMDFFGYCKDDVIICERCDSKAVDIHHIHGRGKDKNVIENLIALCRDCHTLCHSNKDINRHGEVVHLTNVLKELKNRKDKK